MEAIDQRKSTRTNHKSRSGNPEFEFEFTVDLSEFSGKPEDEEADGREKASNSHTCAKPTKGEQNRPMGEWGGGGGGMSGVKCF
jgi:hypothetical protein